MSIGHIAEVSIRYDVSPPATSAIVTSFLLDLIEAKYLTPDMSYLAVDPMKVRRARKAIMERVIMSEEKLTDEEPVRGLFIDGRKDLTLVLEQNPLTNKFHMRTIKEEHITVTCEPDGRYLTHYTTPKAILPNKPAKEAAFALYNWMVPRAIHKSLEVIGGDSTNSMTGSGKNGDLLSNLEQLVGRKLFWSICMLHCNELLLRHIIVELDGPTNLKDGLTGPIGKALFKVNSIKRLETGEPIEQLELLIEIPEKVLKTMSTDAALCYKLVQCLSTAKMDINLCKAKCGNICHSRWLTTTAFIFLYMSDHTFTGDVLRKFYLIVKWVAQVYFHMWYESKTQYCRWPRSLSNTVATAEKTR
ncbi:uncharacterized protein LOC136096891 [Hydra vulgaris]|uniref:uncharacterized protein LOC136096891 n=1 Tax=Hydra vulgaris TaxID=6087 RepID=UPI0032EA80BB